MRQARTRIVLELYYQWVPPAEGEIRLAKFWYQQPRIRSRGFQSDDPSVGLWARGLEVRGRSENNCACRLFPVAAGVGW